MCSSCFQSGGSTTMRRVHMLAMILVLIGAINWGLIGTFRYNFVSELSKKIGGRALKRTIYVIVGIAALALMFHRDIYLPFLGESVIPCNTLSEKVPNNHDKEITINTYPEARVLYWASEGSSEDVKADPWIAYSKYENSGLVIADKDGKAVLKVRDPSKYKVPIGKTLEKHIHYRVCKKDEGMMSRVETVYL